MFKKNKKQTETLKEPKEKKVRTVKVGTHKKTVDCLRPCFNRFFAVIPCVIGLRKVFHEIFYPVGVLQAKFNDFFFVGRVLVDSSKILIHSKAHACDKHHPQRNHGFLTKELQDLNVDTIRTDIPTNSTVTDVIVWSIEQSGTDTFSATYEVDQQIKEGEQTSNVKATYIVKVHVELVGISVLIVSTFKSCNSFVR